MKNRFMLLKYLEMVDDQIINYMVKKVLICLNMRQLFKIIIAYISLWLYITTICRIMSDKTAQRTKKKKKRGQGYYKQYWSDIVQNGYVNKQKSEFS